MSRVSISLRPPSRARESLAADMRYQGDLCRGQCLRCATHTRMARSTSSTRPGAPSTGCPTSDRWAEVAASLLKPGGFLYMAEAHPVTLVFEEIEGRLVPHLPLANTERATHQLRCSDDLHGRHDTAGQPAHARMDASAVGYRRGAHCRRTAHRVPARARAAAVAALPDDGARRRQALRLPDGMVAFPLSFSIKAVKALEFGHRASDDGPGGRS